jgi:hypothetical protein
MPPSPVVVDVPARDAPSPTPAFALRESAPKLMPQTVIGMSRCSGRSAKRVPSTVLVSQRSR